MTYPVDDRGNPRVDFVWGNMAMQPDQQRGNDGYVELIGPNGAENHGWSGSVAEYASDLNTTENQYLSVGDQSDGGTSWLDIDTRTVSVPTTHDIATTGYSNFPAFIPDYSGDGDAVLELLVPELSTLTPGEAQTLVESLGLTFNRINTHVGATTSNTTHFISQSPATGTAIDPTGTVNATYFQAPVVPNIVGLTEAAATTALTSAHLIKGAVTTANNAAGATALNDGKIKTQSIIAGTAVDTGTSVALVKYAYTVTANPIAGISQNSFPGHVALTGNDVYMFLLGRTTKPSVGNTIIVQGNSSSALNQNWTVTAVEDNDSYNSGGTVVTMTAVGGGVTGVAGNTGGTWTVNV